MEFKINCVLFNENLSLNLSKDFTKIVLRPYDEADQLRAAKKVLPII